MSNSCSLLTLQRVQRMLRWLVLLSITAQFLSSGLAAPETPTSSPPKVTAVSGKVALHQLLAITCEGLKEWAAAKDSSGKQNDPAALILYLDGHAMKGLSPTTDQVTANTLFFRLDRISGDEANKGDNHKAWDSLFSGPKGVGQIRNVRVTVGPDNGIPFESKVTAPLCTIDTAWFCGWVAFAIALLIGMFALARGSNLLRDAGDAPQGEATETKLWFFTVKSVPKKPYSIARWQMAFWFYLIVVAYLFIFMITGATDTITASVLGLMGISAGTGLGAVAVDNAKRAQAKSELTQLKAEEAKLQEQQNSAPDKFSAENAQRLKELSGETGLVAKQQAFINPSKSEGFLYDLLSDADGISFHRLQIAVWTVVLGIIFADSVYHVLSMPTFSETLLGLMGISGGTYIGFKLPEKLS